MNSRVHGAARKAGRWLLTSVEVLIGAGFVLAIGYALLGHFQWRHTRSTLGAQGEKLSMAELAPPAIPREKNFFGNSLWEELFQSPPAPGPKMLDALNLAPTSAELSEWKTRYPALKWPSHVKTRLGMAQILWSDSRLARQAISREEAARLTLELLTPSEPVLQRITALLARPDSRMLADYAGLTAQSPLYQPIPLLQAAGIWGLRARAHLVLDQNEAALAEVRALEGLCQIGQREPIFFVLQIRCSMAQICTSVIRQGLERKAWSPSDLEHFEQSLASVNLLGQLPLALRGERCQFNTLVETLRPFPAEPDDSGWSKFSKAIFGQLYRSVLFPADMAYFNRSLQESIQAAEEAPRRGIGASKFPEPPKASRWAGDPRYELSDAMMPPVSRLACMVAFAQSGVDQTRVACALARYFQEKGSYPEALSALAPKYLPEVPRDVITLAELPYRRTKEGGFELWSVGWDEVDDHGRASERNSKFKGDWAWNQRVW